MDMCIVYFFLSTKVKDWFPTKTSSILVKYLTFRDTIYILYSLQNLPAMLKLRSKSIIEIAKCIKILRSSQLPNSRCVVNDLFEIHQTSCGRIFKRVTTDYGCFYITQYLYIDRNLDVPPMGDPCSYQSTSKKIFISLTISLFWKK